MTGRYGVPYKGSKNQIAEKIIDVLPAAANFYDLFAGGCAVTHAAIKKGKWQNYIINDIDGAPTELFVNAIKGKYENEKRWISRESFKQLRENDPYVRYCWSFCNNGRSYLYGKGIEPWKKALHFARVKGDCSLLAEMGIDSDGSREDIRIHYEEYKEKYAKYILKLENKPYDMRQLESLQNLESLQRLKGLQSLEGLEFVERLVGDYQSVRLKPDSIIYCDIPYRNTSVSCRRDEYGAGFDYERFYSWAEQQVLPVFISEYSMPEERFEVIAEFPKRVLFAGNDSRKLVSERIYRPRTQSTENANVKTGQAIACPVWD